MQEVLIRPSSRGSVAVSIVALLASIAATNAPANAHSRQTEKAVELDVRVAKIAYVAHQQQGLRSRLPKAAVMAWLN
jgi:hypothetical protein